MKFCPSCGEELIDNAKFCKSCGMKMEDAGHTGNAHFTPEQIEIPEENHTIAVILGYIFAILIPLLGIIIAVYLFTRNNRPKHAKYILIISIFIILLGFIRIH